jgi:hypothetical protein
LFEILMTYSVPKIAQKAIKWLIGEYCFNIGE